MIRPLLFLTAAVSVCCDYVVGEEVKESTARRLPEQIDDEVRPSQAKKCKILKGYEYHLFSMF